jgi:uncharacterized protein DUF5681
MSEDANDRDYDVGYGKPPTATRFKKGQTGNPKGRPKGAKGLQASLKRELESKITIYESGRTLRITKAEAMAKQLMNKALKGGDKAIMALLRLDSELYGSAVAQLEAETEGTAQMPEPVDYDILRDFFVQPEGKGEDDTIEDWEIDDWQLDEGERGDDGD